MQGSGLIANVQDPISRKRSEKWTPAIHEMTLFPSFEFFLKGSVAMIGKQVPFDFAQGRLSLGVPPRFGMTSVLFSALVFLVLVSQARSRSPAFALCAVMETPCLASGIANGCRDLSTAVVLRVREAQPSLKMTELGRTDSI
jgi:hypothetical protein